MTVVMRAMSGMSSLGKTHSRSESTDHPLLRSRSENLAWSTGGCCALAPSPSGILLKTSRPSTAISRSASPHPLVRESSQSRHDAPLTRSTSFALTQPIIASRSIRFSPGNDSPKRFGQLDFPELAPADSASSQADTISDTDNTEIRCRNGSACGGEKDEPSSYRTRLLRLVGKSRRPSTADALALARSASNASNRSLDESSASPMRQVRTCELGDAPALATRRASYPPAVQRSRMPVPVTSVAEIDPAFAEWGWDSGASGQGVGSTSSAQAASDGAEDGGGMAWVQRRKAQREAAAAGKAE